MVYMQWFLGQQYSILYMKVALNLNEENGLVKIGKNISNIRWAILPTLSSKATQSKACKG